MRPAFLLFLALATIGGKAGAQGGVASSAVAGSPLPDLVFESLVQAPANTPTTWESLRGKVVVLEFWATWCAPCIATMPHLNSVADSLRGQPVQFIAVTDEDAKKVSRFLSRRDIRGWVGLDTDTSIFKALKINARPTTIIVGPDGRVAKVTLASELSTSMLLSLLSTNATASSTVATAAATSPSTAPSPSTPAAAGLSSSSTTAPRFSISIAPARTAGGKRRSEGLFQSRGSTLGSLLSFMHNVGQTRVIAPAAFQDSLYSVVATMPGVPRDEIQSLVQRAVESTLRVDIAWETRSMDVWVLSRARDSKTVLMPNPSKTGTASVEQGVFAALAAPIGALVEGLEDVLGRPVIDETGLGEQYDWTLLFDSRRPESVAEEVRRELGLELKQATRSVRLLVVTSRS